MVNEAKQAVVAFNPEFDSFERAVVLETVLKFMLVLNIPVAFNLGLDGFERAVVPETVLKFMLVVNIPVIFAKPSWIFFVAFSYSLHQFL